MTKKKSNQPTLVNPHVFCGWQGTLEQERRETEGECEGEVGESQRRGRYCGVPAGQSDSHNLIELYIQLCRPHCFHSSQKWITKISFFFLNAGVDLKDFLTKGNYHRKQIFLPCVTLLSSRYGNIIKSKGLEKTRLRHQPINRNYIDTTRCFLELIQCEKGTSSVGLLAFFEEKMAIKHFPWYFKFQTWNHTHIFMQSSKFTFDSNTPLWGCST